MRSRLYPPYPSDPALPEVPATLIDILPEDMVIAEPEKPETGEVGERPADTQTPAEKQDNDAASSDNVDNAQLSPEDNSETPEEELAPPEPTLESLINPVYFDLDAYNISVEDKLRLNKLAERLRRPENQHLNLRIEGHCDDRGTRDYNFALGARRADAVARFLKAQGVEADRIQTVSYGKERPIALGNSEAVRAKNRRSQFMILIGPKR
ncbi:MAG: OmpA family protein [Candidatus Puniceispirillaceae bacterium]